MPESLKKKTLNGIVWSSVERFSVQGIQFLVLLVIARILDPKDYGLVGMLTVFFAIAQTLIDSGFSQALIRKQDRTNVDNNTVFYFNTFVSGLLYLVLFFSAPYIAVFYNEPSLCLILRVLGVIVIINGFAVVQRALLIIDINFKVQTKATLIAVLLSGVLGIYMAYDGWGVWALVSQQLSNAFLCSVLLWFYSKWRPSLQYSWKSFKVMFGFSSKLLLSGLLNTIYNNLYQLVIGKFFNAASLGYYTRASQFVTLPSSSLTEVFQRVVYPVLCKIQDEKNRYREVSRIFLRLSTFIIFPIMCVLAGISKPLILILLGEKWLYASELMIPLCFAMMLYPVHALNLNALTVIGRSDLFLKLEIIKKVLGVFIIFISIPLGVKGMCYGAIVGSIFGLFVNGYYTGREIGYGLCDQFRDMFPTIALALLLYVVSFSICMLIENMWLSLITSIIVVVTSFAIITFVFKFEEVKYIKEILK